MKYRLLLLIAGIIITATAVLAAPTPPQIPDLSTLPLDEVQVNISVQGTVSPVSVFYSHAADHALTCILNIDNSRGIAAAVQSSQTESVALDPGTHSLNVTCGDATTIGRSQTVSVAIAGPREQATVRILLTADTAPPNLVLPFNSSISGAVTCQLSSEGTLLRTLLQVPQGIVQTVQFAAPFPLGSRRFDINCANITYNASDSKSVIIEQVPSTQMQLSISPSRVYAGQDITIMGNMTPLSIAVVRITPPAGVTTTANYTTDVNGTLRASYRLPASAPDGEYVVSAFTTDQPGVMHSGTFRVGARSPAIRLSGGKTTILASSAVTVLGADFFADEDVTLLLLGGGETRNGTASTDADGEFSYSFPEKLPAGSYSLTARSGTNTSVTASLTFKVISGTAVGTQTGTTTGEPGAQAPLDGQTPIDVGNVDTGWGVPQLPPQEETTVLPEPTGGEQSPIVEYPPVEEQPAAVQETSSWFSWWMTPLFVLLVIGGTLGALVYTKALDVSSADAFKRSLAALFSRQAEPAVDPSRQMSIKAFIRQERSKGYDDLTIHNALVAKGWSKPEIDKTFDSLYKEG
jgi:hypothetical protein